MEALLVVAILLCAGFYGVKYRYELAGMMNLRCTRKLDDHVRTKVLKRRIEDDTEELADLEKK